MENILENLELKNKKMQKEKFASEHIFQGLRIDNDIKGNNIQNKIMKIKNDQINDLKLIDIRFIPKQAIISQESKSTRHPNFLGAKGITFSSIHNKNFNKNKLKNILNNKIINKKKEIKILPCILSPTKSESKNKSNKLISLTENNVESIKNLGEIKKVKFVKTSLNKEDENDDNNTHNNNEPKIFMTKLNNLKTLSKKNNLYSYFKNTNRKKIEIKNRANTINQTFDKNDIKKNKKLNYLFKINSKTYYSPKNLDNTKIKTENKTSFDWNKKNDKINRFSLKFNSNENSINDATEEELLIYKLLQKNEKLNEFVIKKAERKEKEKNRTFSKKLVNKIKKNSLVKNLQGKNFSSFNPKMLEKYDNNTIITDDNNKVNNKENNYISINENLPKKKEETIDFIETQIKSLYANFPKITKTKKINQNNKFHLSNASILKSSNFRDYDLNINPTDSYNIKTTNNINDDDTTKKKSIIKEEIINLFQDSKIRGSFLNNLKDKEKLKRFLYFLKANDLELNFNKDYEDEYGKIKFQKSEVEKMKNKCRNILEELDKKNNFDLDEYIKEFETKDMNMSFFAFFHYLLMILKNYDKKIVNNTFEIKKESKEQPEDVKYSYVTKKHEMFMNLIDKQFNEGKNMDKLLKKCMNKTRREKEIESINSAINKNLNSTLNSAIKQNRYNRNFYIRK